MALAAIMGRVHASRLILPGTTLGLVR